MSSLDDSLQARMAAVRERIAAAARAAGRDPAAVRLLAVTKTFGADVVAAAARCGQAEFGENYVQEAVDKIEAVGRLAPDVAIDWHFIGPIQSNKTRQIARHFSWIQSIDRLSVAERLSAQRPAGAAPLQVLLQVNISAEDTKSGCAPDAVPALAAAVARLPHLELRGLMAIPAPRPDPQAMRPDFARMRALFEGLRETLRGAHRAIDTLSMGMSADLEAAIAEGSTMVRVGTAIFGARS
ncbi:MAG TPA: YggS family pyridoxal phosphate-dependent enzyme [Burkholderiaceae bacterium]|nr:YggS family pyridoxal phosphate-dependent enzyme [Burkholderiaceae bacterium]